MSKEKIKLHTPAVVVAFLSLFIVVSDLANFYPPRSSANPFILFAQTSTQTTDGATTTTTSTHDSDPSIIIIRELGNTFGPLAVLVWYLWNNESKRMPAKDKLLVDARADYQNEMRLEREHHQKVTESLVGQLQKNSDMLLQIVQKCPGRPV